MATDFMGNWVNPDMGGGGFGMKLGGKTFDLAGGAVSDLFAAEGYRLKARGDRYEKENYQLAAQYADKNVQYSEWSTAIKTMQADRQLFKSLGETQAGVAGAGFAASGSALDIMRESAQQGALTHAVLAEQGLIAQEGFRQQAQSYRNMAAAAQVAIDANNKAAEGAEITALFKGAGAIFSLIPGG